MKIFTKYISIVMLSALLLTPSIVQLMHALDSHHETSEICISEDEEHLHDHEVECEVCKFNFNNFTASDFTVFNFTVILKINPFLSFYTSLQHNFNSTTLLRGPPVLV